MSFSNTPDYPIITWKVPIPVDYEISITISGVTRRFVINQITLPTMSWESDAVTGDLLLYGYDIRSSVVTSPLDTVARCLKLGFEKLLKSSTTPDVPNGLPDGGFGFSGWLGSINYQYLNSTSFGRLGRYLELSFFSNPTGGSGSLTLNFGSLFDSAFGWDTQTQSFSGTGSLLTSRSDINPAGTWIPDNRTFIEVRDSVAAAYSAVSSYNVNSYRTISWGLNKEQMILEFPFVYAAQIYPYRRTDTRFADPYFDPNDPNDLYQSLVEASRLGRPYRIWWNFISGIPATFDYEDFFIADQEFINSVNSSLEDVSDNRGKLYQVTIPFIKVQ